MRDYAIRKVLAVAGVGAGVLFVACNDNGTSPARHEVQPSAAVAVVEE